MIIQTKLIAMPIGVLYNTLMPSLYIHIPFCKTKCRYCDFDSKKYPDLKTLEKYLSQINFEVDKISEKISTIYIGGGTPSLYFQERLCDAFINFIQKLSKKKPMEFTIEVNPDDANLEALKECHKNGVNRISIGAQTFDDEILKIIGRRHNKNQTIDLVENLEKIGFENVSLDLIFGLPCQTKDAVACDINIVKNLPIKHISFYDFEFNNVSKKNLGHLPYMSDSENREAYHEAIKDLENCGFHMYEISNFSKNGFESKHNLGYWNGDEYSGIGDYAVTYKIYNQNDKFSIRKKNKGEEVLLTKTDDFKEYIMMGLRKITGIEIKKINERYGIDFKKKYNDEINELLVAGLIELNGNIKLTKRGIDFANQVFKMFL